jgi:tetratricopeptide (TPR) repeat protein
LQIIIIINKGELLFELNRLHEAIECFNRAIQINSHTSMYYNNKADALFALKEYDHALECYNMAIKIDSKNANY